jgi:hypothetical protein
MTTTPQEPVSDPDLLPAGAPDETTLDPVAPGEPDETATESPD